MRDVNGGLAKECEDYRYPPIVRNGFRAVRNLYESYDLSLQQTIGRQEWVPDDAGCALFAMPHLSIRPTARRDP